jgi:quercetin dioxygenase-like cupin family protein
MVPYLSVILFALAALIIPNIGSALDQPPLQRLSPSDLAASAHSGAGVGSSGVTGIQTVILKGDPKVSGLYTILLRVPPHTTIQAHHHPDDRVATVTSGTWNFGYGAQFDEKALKALPSGSFYTEPANQPHFARTGDSPVELQITGFGPSGTQYEDDKNNPAAKK